MVSEITRNSVRRRHPLTERKKAPHRFLQSAADIQDLFDDLAELQHLIDGADVPVNVTDLTQNWFHRSFYNSMKLLRMKLREQQQLLASMTHARDTTEAEANYVRQEYLALKSELRVAYRHRGTVLCDADWQSPVYAASRELELNRHSTNIKEHVLDYKRDGHLDAVPYEQEFVTEYASHLGSRQLHAYLASCGMSAFGALLQWLVQELGLGTSTIALEPMYFENIHLIKSYVPDVVRVSPTTSDQLLNILRQQRPSLIVADAVANCGAIREHDLDAIIQWAASEPTQTIALLMDTTCLPTALLPNGLLAGLPKNVCVAFVESLAKHHQLGMDSVTGGIVLLHASDAFHASFRKTRARNGANIADSSVGALPRPSRELLKRRLQRHSRNTDVLVRRLRKASVNGAGVIESISWLEDGVRCAQWYKGSCLTIVLRKEYRSIELYRQFEELVIDMAKERGLQVTLGTSFGFDVSRLYVTAPSTVFEPPFLRLAVGTETNSEAAALAEILEEVSISLESSWKSHLPVRALEKPSASIAPIIVQAGSALHNKPGLPESVFAGEDALSRYLCPENFPSVPLVELPSDLNPYRAEGIRLFAKMMPLVPLMNIKSIPAFSMLQQAAERGQLEDVRNVIESSSSNTVLSLSVIARLFGINDTFAIVDHNIAPSLTRMLRLFGIEIMMHPGIGHELFGKLAPRSDRARSIGEQPGWLNPGQYTNPDNPDGFARWLAPDLWAQTGGRLDVLSVGLGTCGTMVGVSKALRQYKSDLQVVACCPQQGEAVPGPRERSLLADVTFPWQTVVDSLLELPAQESFAASIKLLRRGLLGGPSSGMNYAGALRYIEAEKESGRIRARLDEKGEVWCAFLCCDSPLPHVDEYFDALGEDFFPTVHDVPALTDKNVLPEKPMSATVHAH